MKIYTKTGDGGETGLFGGPRVRKSDARVEAYGDVDELNAAVGAVRAIVEDPEIDRELARVQDELLCVGAELATPAGAKARSALPPIDPAWTARLERAMDGWDAELPRLDRFVLPGGTRTAAALHVARCVCRRAERRAVALAAEAGVAPEVLAYLNRLSDFLFVAARVANLRARKPEILWDPARAPPPAPATGSPATTGPTRRAGSTPRSARTSPSRTGRPRSRRTSGGSSSGSTCW